MALGLAPPQGVQEIEEIRGGSVLFKRSSIVLSLLCLAMSAAAAPPRPAGTGEHAPLPPALAARAEALRQRMQAWGFSAEVAKRLIAASALWDPSATAARMPVLDTMGVPRAEQQAFFAE